MSLRVVLRTFVDRAGALWSLLCALHCAVLPLALVLIPSVALGFWWNDTVEQVTVLLVTCVALCSLGLGFRRHRGWTALVLVVPGLLLMWSALWVGPIHQSLWGHSVAMACGGFLVGLAHLANLRLNRGHIHSARCAC